MARVTKKEKQKRILTVQGWIIDGAQDNFMLKQMQTLWDIKLRQARNYLKTAYGEWIEDAEIDIEARRAAKVAELQQVKRTLKTQYKGTPTGIRAIVQIEKLIIKLKGLEPPKEHNINANVKHEIKPTKYVNATSYRDTDSKTSN